VLACRCVGSGKTLSDSVTFAGPSIGVDLLTSFSKDITDCIYTGKCTAHHHWEWAEASSPRKSLKVQILRSASHDYCR
jgi:hypothetical protein